MTILNHYWLYNNSRQRDGFAVHVCVCVCVFDLTTTNSRFAEPFKVPFWMSMAVNSLHFSAHSHTRTSFRLGLPNVQTMWGTVCVHVYWFYDYMFSIDLTGFVVRWDVSSEFMTENFMIYCKYYTIFNWCVFCVEKIYWLRQRKEGKSQFKRRIPTKRMTDNSNGKKQQHTVINMVNTYTCMHAYTHRRMHTEMQRLLPLYSSASCIRVRVWVCWFACIYVEYTAAAARAAIHILLAFSHGMLSPSCSIIHLHWTQDSFWHVSLSNLNWNL